MGPIRALRGPIGPYFPFVGPILGPAFPSLCWYQKACLGSVDSYSAACRCRHPPDRRAPSLRAHGPKGPYIWIPNSKMRQPMKGELSHKYSLK